MVEYKMILINNLSTRMTNHRSEVNTAIEQVLDSSNYILGRETEKFESLFANFIEVNHCCCVANGTDAIELALRALGLQSGDKIAAVANASMYSCTGILAIGSIPIFMDVDLNTKLVTLNEVVDAISQGVKAVIVTHLYGQAISEIIEIAEKCRAAGVFLVEDCAQAHGATVQNQKVGSFGDIGCFSFYPTKNLGGLGDGGAIVTNSLDIANTVTQLRQYGWSGKYKVKLAGGRNSRIDEIQASLLSTFLPYLNGWNERRREIASQYSRNITNLNVTLPPVRGSDYVAHLYVLRSKKRNSLRKFLEDNGIMSDIHYPIPDYSQPIFSNQFLHLYLPNTEQLAKEVLTLPCYPEMTQTDVEKVISAVNNWQNP
jgi:dTDP-3-amino-2,3,6-trideoxy-4-keto-D-glucose/dTDP-3-amino-3,4,6-trideoxy-alpha-D-glucose/dTDP-2,6-dideoxy-D-kanosamine transaminase